jgi:two-component system alkaline phosphatase synthesis response regulator PhoP
MANETIFVVDDEPLNTRLIQVNLQVKGYRIEIAHDGVEALEALESGRVKPDLILLDLTMPYMDGFELLNRIKGKTELEAIPVVILSARAHDKDVVIGHSIGAERYLTKPINPAELVTTVREVLDAHSN